MTTSELENRTIAISMRKSAENLVISSQDAIGQSISQALGFSGVITNPPSGPQENNDICFRCDDDDDHINIIETEAVITAVDIDPQPCWKTAGVFDDKVVEKSWSSTLECSDTLFTDACKHNNLALIRNVSRSPSPSLRHADSALDLENDRKSDKSDTSQVPSLSSDAATGLDAVSLTHKDVKAASPTARGDTVRSKKKSWYNSLYPTYKSKCEDFKRLFKELPDDEKLIVDYSCALQRDILMQGRLYASQRHLCFHANIFGWEKVLMLRWTDVTAITKEKMALVIPNAILICTENEKNLLASFTGRDKAYLMLFRIWQNALMDQPMSSQEILQLVHACYGSELGFDSDDEARDQPAPDASEEAVDSSSVELGDASAHGYPQELRERIEGDFVYIDSEASPLWPGEFVDGEVEVAEEVTNGNSEFREEAGDTLPTDMSDTSESEPDKHNSNGEEEKCTSTHEGKLLLQQEFPFNIDQLFTMIFTNSKFNLELLAARGTTDYVQNPWQPQNGLKCRQVSYMLSLKSGPMGPKEVHVTEYQVMNKCSKPGALYSIDCSSENAGIPYADYFSVRAHYCLHRRGERTLLEIHGYVHYNKTMWPLIKAFLEKNAMGGMEEFARLLESRLMGAARPQRPARPLAAPQTRTRRRRRHDVSPMAPPAVGVSPGAALGVRPTPPPPQTRPRWLAVALLLLLALNALLYWRLYHVERTGLDLDHLHTRMSSLSESQAAAWARALETHAAKQRGQLLAWRAALHRTVGHLLQTEQALKTLLETIKPALERAEHETEPREDL